jgi:hypothetical protein
MPRVRVPCALAFVYLVSLIAPAPQAGAVTFGQVDDFESGTTAGWGGAPTTNVADAGPGGAGDHALRIAATGGRVVAVNTAQWTGDYTAAGVTKLLLDVRNENAFPLELRIGFAQGVLGSGGAGDTYVSALPVSVASDGQWHQIALSLAPDAFIPHTANSNPTPDAAAALANVSHFRLLHNPAANFLGANGPATFFVDNIRAVPEPATLALAAGGLGLLEIRRRRARA